MNVSLRLPDDLSNRLQNLAQLTGRSKTFYMLEAIRDHLDDLEDKLTMPPKKNWQS